jgi:hypothetical protein
MSGAITKALQASTDPNWDPMATPGWLPWNLGDDGVVNAQRYEEPTDKDVEIGKLTKQELATEVVGIHNYLLEKVQRTGFGEGRTSDETEYEIESTLLSDRRRWRTNAPSEVIISDELVQSLALDSPCGIYAQLGKLPAEDDVCIGTMRDARIAEDVVRGHNVILASVRRHDRQEIAEWEPEKIKFSTRPMIH